MVLKNPLIWDQCDKILVWSQETINPTTHSHEEYWFCPFPQYTGESRSCSIWYLYIPEQTEPLGFLTILLRLYYGHNYSLMNYYYFLPLFIHSYVNVRYYWIILSRDCIRNFYLPVSIFPVEDHCCICLYDTYSVCD